MQYRHIPAHEWVWYGFAGHFFGGHMCSYHLATRVRNRLISTIGSWRSRGTVLQIGSDKKDIFELMVFPCDGESDTGNPIRGEAELFNCHFEASVDAEQAHRAVCAWIASTPACHEDFDVLRKLLEAEE